jgi:hypothetical protein
MKLLRAMPSCLALAPSLEALHLFNRDVRLAALIHAHGDLLN